MSTTGIWADMTSIPSLENVDPDTFRSEILPVRQPAVLKGAVAHWPAIAEAHKGADALSSYLKAFATPNPVQVFKGPPEIKGRFFYSSDMKGVNFERLHIPLTDLLNELARLKSTPDGTSIYAGGVPIPQVMPDFQKDLDLPLIDPGADKLISLWIGNRTRIAAHWDLPHNIAGLVAGRRRFTVFPTDQLKNLYCGPLDFTLAGQPISLVDFHAPDFEKFPRFHEAISHAQMAELEPGDALYIPSMWWHHVESLDDFGAMVNYWWRSEPDYMFTPLHTIYHALLSLRDLPKADRDAWKVLFDHYIFEQDGEVMDYLPKDARGIMGPMTPDRARSVKDFLGKFLRG